MLQKYGNDCNKIREFSNIIKIYAHEPLPANRIGTTQKCEHCVKSNRTFCHSPFILLN
jgi:hypothetical protein